MHTFFESTELFKIISSNKAKYIQKEQLQNAYDDFVNQLETVVQDMQDYQKQYRMLATIHNELALYFAIQRNADHRQKNLAVSEQIAIAERQVEVEQSLLEEHCAHPERFIEANTTTKRSFVWSEKYSKRDLMELVIALDKADAVKDMHGQKVAFKTLVDATSHSFSVDLSKMYRIREEILSRKIKSTAFLDILRHSILESE